MEKKTGNRIVRKGVAKMAQVVRKEMRRNAPRKSGKLNKELRYKVRRDKRGGFTAQVGAFNDAYYARFLEGGAKPHTITPKNKKGVSVGGKVYKSIKHPGIRATRFISKSFETSRHTAIKQAGEIMMKELLKL